METPLSTPEELNDRKKFLEIVDGMDLPKHRVLNHDYEWIYRNASIKNKSHPKIEELFTFLKSQFSKKSYI